MTGVIDAHLHVWDLDRAEYAWLGPGAAPINRTVELDDVRPALDGAGVDGVVLVQAADNLEDTRNMLRVADAHPEVVAVVGWVPLDDPRRAAGLLEELRADPRIAGIRNLIHDREDPDWILGDAQQETLGMLAARRIPFDYVTASPAALRHLPVLRERHPDLPLVLDHLGKPPIGGSAEERREWRSLLADAAANPRLTAKVSGLYASRGPLDSWTIEEVRPFVEDALELLGADRLMFGGDWPVSVLAGGYDRTWDALSGIAAGLSPAERDALLGGTAARVYGITEERITTAPAARTAG